MTEKVGQKLPESLKVASSWAFLCVTFSSTAWNNSACLFKGLLWSLCASLKGVGDCFCRLRYITANTDTEEQSFPVPKALNTHIEDLKLDVLLQKVDHLRLNEAHKMESFELLCDHKEKVRAV